MRKRILAFICVLSFCFTTVLCVPASAAGSPVDFKDYEYGLDGDDKLITVKIPNSWNYYRLWNGTTRVDLATAYYGSWEFDGDASARLVFFPFGTIYRSNTTIYNGRYLKFANIPVDTSITYTMRLHFSKEAEDLDGGYWDSDDALGYVCYFDGTYAYQSPVSYTLVKDPDSFEHNGYLLDTYLISFSFKVLSQYVGAFVYIESPTSDCSSNILYWHIVEQYLTFTIDYEYESWKDDQEIKDSLDGIQDAIDAPAAPVTPDGGSDVDDLGSAEDQLLDNVGGGLDNVGAAQGQASAGVSQYASGFAFLAAGVDFFAGELDWVSYLLYISLSVGTVGAILGIVPGIFHSKSSSGGKKKGGG